MSFHPFYRKFMFLAYSRCLNPKLVKLNIKKATPHYERFRSSKPVASRTPFVKLFLKKYFWVHFLKFCCFICTHIPGEAKSEVSSGFLLMQLSLML